MTGDSETLPDFPASDVVSDVVGAVDPQALLGDDGTFESVLDGDRSGPTAVVGPPYSGRERLLDAAADRLDARHVRLAPDTDPSGLFERLGEEPLVIGNCQHLFDRRIGGFAPLAEFTESLAGVRTPVVTGWNATAWTYLDAVRTLERSFPTRVEIDPLDAAAIADVVSTRRPLPDCRRDGTERDREATVERRTIRLGDRELAVPIPRLPTIGSDRSTADPTDAVFERLTSVADGNLGVATAIFWRCSDEVLHPGDVSPVGVDLDFDDDERFCLRLLSGSELASRPTLRSIVGEEFGEILGRFDREGLVVVGDERVRLLPAAVPTATSQGGRIL